MSQLNFVNDLLNNTAHTHVWQANESSMAFYAEDSDGHVIVSGSPIVTLPFIENVSIAGVCKVERRLVTGRPRKKNHFTEPYEYNCSVEDLYLDRKIELRLNDVLSHGVPLRIVFGLIGLQYVDVDNDYHILKHAMATRFNITSRNNDIVHASMEFEAEDLVTDLSQW